MFNLARTTGRQREIVEILLRNGWGYIRQLMAGEKSARPTLPPPEILKRIFVELGPVWIKAGQLLSTRPDLLGPEYIASLETLQARVPPVPWDDIEGVLRQEFPQPWSELFADIDQVPVAAGSIAQIHRARLNDGRWVAIKVQRPGIDVTVRQDIALLKGLADLIAHTEIGQIFAVKSLAEELAGALEGELDFTGEAKHTTELLDNMRSCSWFDPTSLTIPTIEWNLTSRRVLTMEWLAGGPVLNQPLLSQKAGATGQQERQDITRLLFRTFFQQIFIDGLFHADPHPGNIFYLDDGRIALLDCGMVGHFDPLTQQILAEFILSIIAMDAQRCAQLTLRLAESTQPVELVKLETDVNRLLRKHYTANLAEMNFSAIIADLLQAARDNRLRVPGSLGLFAKTLANLEGVARKFYPEVNIIDEMRPLITDLFRRQLLGEDPQLLLLRTLLDLRNLTLHWPRRMATLLDQMGNQSFQWNVSIRGIERLRRSGVNAANRLSFAIVVGSLIVGAAIMASSSRRITLSETSSILFVVASLLGLWLIVSVLRSGRNKM